MFPFPSALLAAVPLVPWPWPWLAVLTGVAAVIAWATRQRDGAATRRPAKWRRAVRKSLFWGSRIGLIVAACQWLLAGLKWLLPDVTPAVDPIWPWPLVLLVGAGLLALVLSTYPRRLQHLPLRTQRILLGLRLTTLAILLFALFRPSVQWEDEDKRSALFAIVLDPSRSMTTPDGPGGETRHAAARRLFEENKAILETLAKQAQIELFEWKDGAPVPVQEWTLEPTVEQTPLGQVLDELARQAESRKLVGILLMSDGSQRALPPHDLDPRVAAQRLFERQVHIHAVPFGSSSIAGSSLDVALEDLQVSPTVFVKNQVIVQAKIRASGIGNRELTARLLLERPAAPGSIASTPQMDVVGTPQKIMPTGDETLFPVELSFTPEQAGEYKLAVEVVPLDGELVLANNQLATYITVRKGGLTVAYFDRKRPEQKYIRQMNESPDIQVDFLEVRVGKRFKPLDIDPDWFKPGQYDVFILGDVPPEAFDQAGQPQRNLLALKTCVERGAGLMMTGGSRSFGAGGWAATPIADLLPVTLRKTDVRSGDQLDPQQHILTPLQMLPTTAGVQHFVMRLDEPARNRAAWQALAPLSGANKFTEPKPLALVLAESEAKQPLLLAQDVGQGRVIALGADTTFQWVLAGQHDAYQRFWRQTILWLAHKDQQGDGAVWVQLDQRRLRPGQPLGIEFGARNEQGAPIAGAEFTVEVTNPAGQKQQFGYEKLGEQFFATWPRTELAGDYVVKVEARQGGTSLGTAQARFLVYEQDLELHNPAADFSLLEEISRMTGGRTVAPEQLNGLLNDLAAQGLRPDETTYVVTELWDNWPLVALFVIMLSTEWFYRKYRGLV